MPIVLSTDDASPQGERLLVASRLATSLARLHTAGDVAERRWASCTNLRLLPAVVQRLNPDGCLRVVNRAGPLSEELTTSSSSSSRWRSASTAG
jgi:hypothetical protein